jgi:hypothetical protein
VCTERKLHSNWHSPANTPSLSPTIVVGLRVLYSRHRSSHETHSLPPPLSVCPGKFVHEPTCLWWEAFVNQGSTVYIMTNFIWLHEICHDIYVCVYIYIYIVVIDWHFLSCIYYILSIMMSLFIHMWQSDMWLFLCDWEVFPFAILTFFFLSFPEAGSNIGQFRYVPWGLKKISNAMLPVSF